MTKVLVVDDSALMRKHLTNLLEGEFEVMTARNGVEALACLDSFDPDVITLDINMPEMDGITCLSNIMNRRPKPVVMVSSLTEEGAEVTLQALSLGAVDYVRKPDGTISLSIERIHRELLEKIRAASRARVRRSTGLASRVRSERSRISERVGAKRQFAPLTSQRHGLVLVGVSTGGPGTLEDILPLLPANFPWSIVIAQHMPGSFTAVFARRLNDMCAMTVTEVTRQMPLEPGTVYVAKGDADLVILRRGAGYAAAPVPASADFLWHPSVQRMVASAIEAAPANRLMGVQLTGMGDDGAEGMADLNRRGGRTIAQDAETSIVFGMPNELIKRGGADVVLGAGEIAGQLVEWLMPGMGKEAKYGAR
jgi:two-component system chemotaxis response regulator CheB